jgi:hypothetical protein
MRLVEEFLCALNDMDQRQILTVFCFHPSQAEISSTSRVASIQPPRPRILSLTTTLDMSWFIENEWGAEAGNMLVAGKTRVAHTTFIANYIVCGSPQFELRARKAVRSSSHEIDFRNSVFQPSETQTSKLSGFRYHQGKGD